MTDLGKPTLDEIILARQIASSVRITESEIEQSLSQQDNRPNALHVRHRRSGRDYLEAVRIHEFFVKSMASHDRERKALYDRIIQIAATSLHEFITEAEGALGCISSAPGYIPDRDIEKYRKALREIRSSQEALGKMP